MQVNVVTQTSRKERAGMSFGDGSSVSQWLQGGMREAGAVQPLGEPSWPSCGTGNSHLRFQEQHLRVPGTLPAQPPHSSTRVPPRTSLGALHDHQLGKPSQEGRRSPLSWCGTQGHSSSKGKCTDLCQVSKEKHLPKQSWFLALPVSCPCFASFHLLLAAPQNVFQEKHPTLPRSGSLTHFKHTGVGSGLVPSSPAELGFSNGPLWRLPWDGGGGMDPGREWRSWLVKSTLYHVGENKTSPTG